MKELIWIPKPSKIAPVKRTISNHELKLIFTTQNGLITKNQIGIILTTALMDEASICIGKL
jgi:hypothetical protein